jgi:hypothetical protein
LPHAPQESKAGVLQRLKNAADQDSKEESGHKTILPTDVFIVNPKFQSKTHRVRLMPGMSHAFLHAHPLPGKSCVQAQLLSSTCKLRGQSLEQQCASGPSLYVVRGSADEAAKFHAVGSVRETEKEAKETQDQVGRGRDFYVDAVIVRIMKARKQLLHNDLIAQVVDNCKGTRVVGCQLPSVS